LFSFRNAKSETRKIILPDSGAVGNQCFWFLGIYRGKIKKVDAEKEKMTIHGFKSGY